MKKSKIFGNILFWLTLICPIFSFALASEIGESNVFGVAGIIRYSWIMLLFVPIGILSILIGLKLKNNKQKYKKNFIIAFICLPLLIIFGSYRFIFNNVVSYDVNQIYALEESTGIDLPNQVKIATIDLELYKVSYIKITDEVEKTNFESEIKNNSLWETELRSKIKILLPLDIQYESTNFDYFVFYNLTYNEYNSYPADGECDCIFIAYDREMQRLVILSNYTIDLY